ncbi:MAG: hypothetical protein A7316_03655 [Candidatus Altiarchaeales archaeon WOR_SM1_86-2]|nr:MAG: hypothetical protein A7316_03655 [Candidatus Altiarchaeales archaeon WOR_SM1_86-2]
MISNKDTELLKLLENDARIPEKDIATMLDITDEDAKNRIKDLKDKGIIKGFKTVIDWKKAGKRRVYAIIQVKVTPQERAGFARAAKEISKDARVNGVYVATGEYDLMVFLQGGSIDDISDFVTEKLAPKKEVIGTNTHIILNVFKKDGLEFFGEDAKRLLVSP